MKSADLERIANWVIARGLDGASGDRDPARLLRRVPRRRHRELSRAFVIDTLHPVYEGTRLPLAERRRRGDRPHRIRSHLRGRCRRDWQRSVFLHLLKTGGEEFAGGSASANRRTSPQRGIKAEGRDGRHRLRAPFARGATSARWTASIRVDDRQHRWLQRGGYRGLAPPGAALGPGDQMRIAGAHRRDARRGLPRPRRRPARAERPHPGASPTASRGAVVFGPERLHDHHRHRRPTRSSRC